MVNKREITNKFLINFIHSDKNELPYTCHYDFKFQIANLNETQEEKILPNFGVYTYIYLTQEALYNKDLEYLCGNHWNFNKLNALFDIYLFINEHIQIEPSNVAIHNCNNYLKDEKIVKSLSRFEWFSWIEDFLSKF